MTLSSIWYVGGYPNVNNVNNKLGPPDIQITKANFNGALKASLDLLIVSSRYDAGTLD